LSPTELRQLIADVDIQVAKVVAKPASASTSPASKKAEQADEGPEVPPLSNLLEFVAWLVLLLSGEEFNSQDGSNGRLLDWTNGRGGFLSDEMDAVRDASVRLQVLFFLLHRHPNLATRCVTAKFTAASVWGRAYRLCWGALTA